MTTRDALVQELRAAGLRATSARIAVLGALHRLGPGDEPVSHPELAAALAPEGWDRATVYRNLIDLVEVGIATKQDLGDHTWRFALKASAPETPEGLLRRLLALGEDGVASAEDIEAFGDLCERMPRGVRKELGLFCDECGSVNCYHKVEE